MPRVFLHISNSIGHVKDEEGTDVDDIQDARARAIESIRSIVGEEAKQGLIDLRGRIDVEEQRSGIVLTIPFAEAFCIRCDPEGETPSE